MSTTPTNPEQSKDVPEIGSVPSHYVCTTCGATGVKLWRETAASAEDITLLCAACLCAERELDLSTMDSRTGCINERPYGPNNCFGIYLPAVPVEGTRTFWMHAYVPSAGANWWYELPLIAAA